MLKVDSPQPPMDMPPQPPMMQDMGDGNEMSNQMTNDMPPQPPMMQDMGDGNEMSNDFDTNFDAGVDANEETIQTAYFSAGRFLFCKNTLLPAKLQPESIQ